MAKKRLSSSKADSLQKYYDFLVMPPTASGTKNKPGTKKRSSISDELAREKKLKNDDTEQDIQLKKITLNRLFILLACETIITFFFAFLQATHLFNFGLEEWSFNLLSSVTITQITVMLFVAVNYLFPKKKL